MSLSKKQNFLYWRLWSAVCRQQEWKNGDDNHRHACHVQALGFDKPHADFTNDDFDKIITLFKHLSQPDSLSAQIEADQYQDGDDPGLRRRYLWIIKQAGLTENYWHDYYSSMHDSGRFSNPLADWQTLPISELKTLMDFIVNRARKLRQKAA